MALNGRCRQLASSSVYFVMPSVPRNKTLTLVLHGARHLWQTVQRAACPMNKLDEIPLGARAKRKSRTRALISGAFVLIDLVLSNLRLIYRSSQR